MIWRVRDRATFEALAGTRRVRRGPLSLRHLADGGRPRVAFAIGRSAGSAVARNRIRRRLRAAIAARARAGQLPPGAYLFGAGPEALTMSAADLDRSVAALVATTRGSDR